MFIISKAKYIPTENKILNFDSLNVRFQYFYSDLWNGVFFSHAVEKEKKKVKKMVTMGNMISEKLKSIKGLSERPIVNCTTCHRGDLKPAFRMPPTNNSNK